MSLSTGTQPSIHRELLEAVRSFPLEREVVHCDQRFTVSPFDCYAVCPQCGTQIKVRGMSALVELEDLFDTVFEWMLLPEAAELVKRRQQTIAEDVDE